MLDAFGDAAEDEIDLGERQLGMLGQRARHVLAGDAAFLKLNAARVPGLPAIDADEGDAHEADQRDHREFDRRAWGAGFT